MRWKAWSICRQHTPWSDSGREREYHSLVSAYPSKLFPGSREDFKKIDCVHHCPKLGSPEANTGSALGVWRFLGVKVWERKQEAVRLREEETKR